MIINRNSWHYKLLMLMGKNRWDVPQNLCPYVRSVVWSIVKLTSYLIVCVCTVAFWFIPELTTESTWYEVVARSVGAVFNFGITLIIVILMLVGIINMIKTKFNNTLKEPNIFVEYYKAWHDKVCPTLEFKSKENK